jgi:hypothetical protein
MERKRLILIVSVLVLITIGGYIIFSLISKEKEEKTRSEEEKITEEIHKGLTEGLAENEQEKSLTSPVEIIKHGWRILYRTVPKEGYMWEWAVELENKTEIPTRVLIKYNLFDENGNMVAEGIGGDELAEKERKIIIGRAVSEKPILNAKSSKISVNISPSRKAKSELIIEKWKWSDPYEISQ